MVATVWYEELLCRDGQVRRIKYTRLAGGRKSRVSVDFLRPWEGPTSWQEARAQQSGEYLVFPADPNSKADPFRILALKRRSRWVTILVFDSPNLSGQGQNSVDEASDIFLALAPDIETECGCDIGSVFRGDVSDMVNETHDGERWHSNNTPRTSFPDAVLARTADEWAAGVRLARADRVRLVPFGGVAAAKIEKLAGMLEARL
mmetsp:Transcript_28089/g.84177  ORF Transcript_28089/g.84177 Transcript_28089/m.84177 type:complete len:204 (-) Transcript_28089:59-670(-)